MFPEPYLSINDLSVFSFAGVPRVAVAIKGYYDGGGVHGKHVVLAGYAASPEKWSQFESGWKDMLAGDGTRPAAAYLHMTDANALQDDFSPEHGWDRKGVRRLLMDVANYISRNFPHGEAVHSYAGASCTIPLDDYNRAVQVIPNLARKEPEAICVDQVISVALRVLPEAKSETDGILGKSGSAELVFDRNEAFYNKIYRVWNVSYRLRNLPLKLVSAMAVADAPSVPGLQAADFLAWTSNKHMWHDDANAALTRMLTSPARHVDLNYDLLLERYKDYNGEVP